jgi:hypothetical protein
VSGRGAPPVVVVVVVVAVAERVAARELLHLVRECRGASYSRAGACGRLAETGLLPQAGLLPLGQHALRQALGEPVGMYCIEFMSLVHKL